MRKNILLVGLENASNYGDPIIYNCTKYLLSKENKNFIYNNLNLNPKINTIYTILNSISEKIGWNKFNSKLIINEYKRSFNNKIKKSDAIIFAGGGLIKYKYQYFWSQISAIIDLASQYNIPVYFNAVGIEGYDEYDFKCQHLKEQINKNCIRIITTRDDIQTLNNKYISNHNIKTFKVAAPAIFCSKIYNIQKKESNIIGIGLIRGKIFTDNGLKFSEKSLLNLYINLINELQSKKERFQLFTNGVEEDLELANRVCRYCKLDPNKDLVIPQNPQELIEIISKYKCVIATRLHACIISYSLNIPAIGLVWNNKLKMFGKCINYPERFLEINDLTTDKIIKTLDKIKNEKYDSYYRIEYEFSQKQSIIEIVKDINSKVSV